MIGRATPVEKANQRMSDLEAAQFASELLDVLEQQPELFDTKRDGYFNMCLGWESGLSGSQELYAIQTLTLLKFQVMGTARASVVEPLKSFGIDIRTVESKSGCLSVTLQKGNGHIVVFC